MRFLIVYLVFAVGLSSILGGGAALNGILIRDPGGNHVAYGGEAFWHLAPIIFAAITILGLFLGLLIALLDWAMSE